MSALNVMVTEDEFLEGNVTIIQPKHTHYVGGELQELEVIQTWH